MSAVRKTESVLSPLAWGGPNAPLLPASLRNQWREERLPAWVCKELDLPDGSTMEQLKVNAGGFKTGLPQRIQNFLVFLIQSRRDAIASVVVIDRVWPPAFSFDSVPWRRRTKNCLLRVGMQRRLSELHQITFGELLAIPTMGPLSVLDFACTLEATMEEDHRGLPVSAELAQGAPKSPRVDPGLSNTLLQVLDEPWADWVSEQDPRFDHLLPPDGAPRGTLTERIDRLSSALDTRDGDLETLARAIDSVRYQVERIATLPLETALREYAASVSGVRDRRLPALLARLHWDGSESAKTLEEAGKMIGVSRERIRQLQERLLKRLPKHPVVMPAMDRALVFLASKAPIEPRAAADLLAEAGISERPFHPRSLLAAAEACGRTPGLYLDRVRNHELLVLDPAQASGEQVISTAHAQARTSGATNVAEVVGEANARYGLDIPPERVRQLVERYGDVEFLDDQWFWCPKRGDDFLRTVSRKMLSVASPIGVSVLRDGVRRAFKFRSISGSRRWRTPNVPPRNVLAGYYRAHPDFVIGDTEMVRPARPLNYRSELAGVEQTIVTVLRASPTNFLDRTELLEACEERGINPGSLGVFLTYSPVIQRLGTGLWGLRGIQVDPAVLEAVRQANSLRPREKRVIDFGWTPDGSLWVAVRLPKDAGLQVFGIPAAVSRFVEGRDFPARTEAGSPCGQIRVQEYGSCYGHAEFLRRAGADEGDILHLSFDLAKGQATLALIDDESLEEISPTL